MEWSELISGAVGSLVGSGILWQVGKHGAQKWLDHQFNLRLQDLKHEQDVLVRQTQSRIDREIDRSKRLYAKEFEALQEGWAAVHEAYWLARQYTSKSTSIHSFEMMSAAQQASFIDRCDLEDWQKAELQALTTDEDRDTYYLSAERWRRLERAKKAKQKLVMFVDQNAIFLRPAIREKMDALCPLIDDALLEYRMRLEQGGNPYPPGAGVNQYEKSEALEAAQASLYTPLETLIHERVWSQEATAVAEDA